MVVGNKKSFQILGQAVPTVSEFKAAHPFDSEGFRFWLRWHELKRGSAYDRLFKRQIRHMASTHYHRLSSNTPSTVMRALAAYVQDLSGLWKTAAQLSDPEQALITRMLYAATDDETVLKAQRKIEVIKTDRCGPVIWDACQQLDGEALEFAWDYEIWRERPSGNIGEVMGKLYERAKFYRKNPWARIEEAAPPPKYPQDGIKAQALLDRLDQGQLKASSKREANNLAQDLVRAAAHFWNLAERMKAVDVFRALSNPTLCPDERGQRLLKAAARTFTTVPTTPQAISNYLRKK